MGTLILFLTLCITAYVSAQTVDLIPAGEVKLSSSYSDRLARFTAVDEDNDLIYLTGDSKLFINKLTSDSLTLEKTMTFTDKKLGQIRLCGGYVTVVMTDTADVTIASLEIFEVYDTSSGDDLVPVLSHPLPPSPGYHRITADCSTVIMPISERAQTQVGTGEVIDGDGMIMILEFAANFASFVQGTNLTFDSFESQRAALVLNGALLYAPVSFTQGLEPVDVCLSSDESKAYVVLSTNNIIATVDIGSAQISSLQALGAKDFRVGDGFDANSKDGFTLNNYDIRGAYTPSRIDCFEAGGVEYFVTGNDGRPAYRNVVKLANLVLDPTLFPDTRFQKKRWAGRLKVWDGGDIDGDGDVDVIYAIGSRSVSIWFADTVTLVADTGSMIEEQIGALKPDYFNADPNKAGRQIGNSFDLRSVIRGPEPKGVAVFNTCKNRYLMAVVGLEMPGGIMVFSLDYSNPAAGFTFMNLAMPINATTTTTWNQAWMDGEASMMGVQSISLYNSRNPIAYAAGNIGSTLTGYELDIECV